MVQIETKEETLIAVAFAYFTDGEFIGWYADSFGSVRNFPKIYRNSERQLGVIEGNFNTKLKRISETTFDEAKEKVTGLGALSLPIFDSEELLRGKAVELKVVALPFYEETDDYYKWLSEKHQEIKDWASNVPTEFINTIKHN